MLHEVIGLMQISHTTDARTRNYRPSQQFYLTVSSSEFNKTSRKVGAVSSLYGDGGISLKGYLDVDTV